MTGSRSLRSERGAMLTLFAILVPLLLIPIGAIVVDIGFWYTNARKAQTTADAAALAAAREIDSDAAATNAGGEYVGRNMPGLTVNIPDNTSEGCPSSIPSGSYCVEYPYKPSVGTTVLDEVEVVVNHPASTFFGRIFGMFGISSTRRAVAEQWKSPGDMAVYVNSTICTGGESLEFNNGGMDIFGRVHSEGFWLISVGTRAANKDFFATRATQRDGPPPPTVCNGSYQGDIQFGPTIETNPKPQRVPTVYWPVFYTPSQFGFYSAPTETSTPIDPGTERTDQCRFKGEEIIIKDTYIEVKSSPWAGNYAYSGNVLPTGIYCATKIFKMDTTERRTGNITVLSMRINVDATANTVGYNAAGQPAPLTGYAGSPDRVLFFQVPNVTPTTTDDGVAGAPPPPNSFNKLTNCKKEDGTTQYPNYEMGFNSDGMRWDGVIFHPCGRVLINKGGFTGTGSIIADRVKVDGSNISITGRNNFEATINLGLVE